MRRRRALRALLVGAALAAASLFVTSGLLFYRPLPTIDGYYRLLGLHQRGEVVRDVNGVPHIYARDPHDLFFLQGYVTAQDRLAQMEALRGEARARLGAASDLAADRSPPALRERLDAYAEGVSKLTQQLADARALPAELVLSGRRPAPWRAGDTLAIVGAFLEHIAPLSVCAAAPAAGTRDGRPILAADLYLDAAAPGWYEAGIEGDGWHAAGASLPGVPGIVAGSNGWVAWALLSSARRASDPAATLGALLGAMPARTAASFADAMRRATVATCLADIAGRLGGTDQGLAAFVPADRAAVLGGDGGRGAAIVASLDGARGLDLEAMRGLLGRPPAMNAGARVVIDLGAVDGSRSAISQGISGHRASPHYGDQRPLWEIGRVHRLPLTRPAIGLTDGDLVFRAR